MTFHQAIHVVLTDYPYKLILPDWALSLTTKSRQVRDAFNELRVCVYIPFVSSLITIHLLALHMRHDSGGTDRNC